MFGGVNLTSSGNFEVQWFIHTSKIHSFTFELSSSHLESLMFTRQAQYTQRIWESSFIDVLWLLLKHIAEGFHSFIVSCLKTNSWHPNLADRKICWCKQKALTILNTSSYLRIKFTHLAIVKLYCRRKHSFIVSCMKLLIISWHQPWPTEKQADASVGCWKLWILTIGQIWLQIKEREITWNYSKNFQIAKTIQMLNIWNCYFAPSRNELSLYPMTKKGCWCSFEKPQQNLCESWN